MCNKKNLLVIILHVNNSPAKTETVTASKQVTRQSVGLQWDDSTANTSVIIPRWTL